MTARSHLRQPWEGHPAFGAIHPVELNPQLRVFLNEFANIADDVFDPKPGDFRQVTSQADEDAPLVEYSPDPNYNPNKFYRVFDQSKLGVTVLDMDPTAKAAKAMRVLWEKQDFGAVKKIAGNEIGRRLPNQRLSLTFGRVISVGGRLPNVPATDIRQKLALVPDETENNLRVLEILTHEADIIGSAIASRLKQFAVTPFDVVPKLTFASFKRDAEPYQILRVIN